MHSLYRDLFANVKATPALAAGFTAETEQSGLAIKVSDLQTKAEQSAALILAGLSDNGGNDDITISANWQQADDAAFTENVEDIPDHEVIAAEVTSLTASGGRYFACLPLNLQLVTRAYVRPQFTVVAEGAGAHASHAIVVTGTPYESPAPRSGAGAPVAV